MKNTFLIENFTKIQTYPRIMKISKHLVAFSSIAVVALLTGCSSTGTTETAGSGTSYGGYTVTSDGITLGPSIQQEMYGMTNDLMPAWATGNPMPGNVARLSASLGGLR
jgi:hypothetical protein